MGSGCRNDLQDALAMAGAVLAEGSVSLAHGDMFLQHSALALSKASFHISIFFTAY